MADAAIINSSALDRGAIDPENFTASLLRQATEKGLLTQQESQGIQEGLLLLLEEQIHQLTQNGSSSLPTQAAERLMDGIGYCVDFYLQSLSTLEDALQALQSRRVSELYSAGKALLDGHAKASEALLSRVRATRLPNPNLGYNRTLDVTLPRYLRDWKSAPYPQSFPVLTEYPLADEQPLPDGIAGVHAYLSALALENRFCGRFASQIPEMLQAFAHQYRTSPEEAYVNLFSLAFRSLLFSQLADSPGILPSTESLQTLESRLCGSTSEQRETLLRQTAEQLLASWKFDNPKLNHYIQEEMERLCHQVELKGGKLSGLAVPALEEEQLVHVDGERLDNDAFSSVVEELFLCDQPERKVQIVQEKIRSLEDLRDLLDSGCIFEEELPGLFSQLDDATCALLLTCCPVEAVGRQVALGGDSDPWQDALADYVNQLEASRRTDLLELFRALSR